MGRFPMGSHGFIEAPLAEMIGAEPAFQAAWLWPAHCNTPRNRAHGPTASRTWCAMILEIWCR